MIKRRYRDLAPIQLRIPPGHRKNWRRYGGEYNACTLPVCFVRDDGYQHVYAPRYRKDHGGGDRRDDRRVDRADDRGGKENGSGHGNGKGRDRDER